MEEWLPGEAHDLRAMVAALSAAGVAVVFVFVHTTTTAAINTPHTTPPTHAHDKQERRGHHKGHQHVWQQQLMIPMGWWMLCSVG